jgi:hypothetical protein
MRSLVFRRGLAFEPNIDTWISKQQRTCDWLIILLTHEVMCVRACQLRKSFVYLYKLRARICIFNQRIAYSLYWARKLSAYTLSALFQYTTQDVHFLAWISRTSHVGKLEKKTFAVSKEEWKHISDAKMHDNDFPARKVLINVVISLNRLSMFH